LPLRAPEGEADEEEDESDIVALETQQQKLRLRSSQSVAICESSKQAQALLSQETTRRQSGLVAIHIITDLLLIQEILCLTFTDFV
jgi:hypothetical protein